MKNVFLSANHIARPPRLDDDQLREYHHSIARLHDHQHGLARLHDHQHSIARLHDHQHEVARLHDHQHDIAKLHDHQHEVARLHDHQHEIARLHDHQSLGLCGSDLKAGVQWGYMKVKLKQDLPERKRHDDSGEENAILFINNTNFETQPGEEGREIYYRVSRVRVQLDQLTSVYIGIAHDFSLISHDDPEPPTSHTK